MAVRTLNPSIFPMNDQLGTLIPADGPPGVNRVCLRAAVSGSPLSATLFHIPPSARTGHNVSRFPGHDQSPFAIFQIDPKIRRNLDCHPPPPYRRIYR